MHSDTRSTQQWLLRMGASGSPDGAIRHLVLWVVVESQHTSAGGSSCADKRQACGMAPRPPVFQQHSSIPAPTEEPQRHDQAQVPIWVA